MKVSAAILRELHRIHKQRADLQGRLALGPRQVQSASEAVARLEQSLGEAKEVIKRARAAAHEKQVQLDQREGRVKDLQAKLNACSSNREFQALKEQIAADDQANSVLADEIFEALEKIDVHLAEAQSRQEELTEAQERAGEVKQRVEGARQKLEAELARVEGELARCEAELPPDFRLEYQRVARSRGEETLAAVDGECCGGCFHTLTTQTLSDLTMSKPMFCKNCGCLLYLPEP